MPITKNSNHLPLTEPHPSGPIPVINPEKRKISKRAIAVGAGILVAVGATFAAVEANTPSDDGIDTSADGGGTQPTVERPEGVTADNASSADFYNDSYFTDKERIDWANNQLQQDAGDPEFPGMTTEQAAYEHVKAQLKRDSDVDLGPLVAPSESNTANEADIQMVTVNAAALYEVDLNKAEKILAASMRHDSDLYESFVQDLVEIHNSNPTKQELITKTIDFSFTPADGATLNATGEIVDMVTGTSTNVPIGNIQPYNNAPTRVAFMNETQTINHVPDFEEVQAFLDNRWVSIQKIESTDTSLWITPKTLINLPAK